MLEVLTLICFAGLLSSSGKKLGFGNPFQLYFLVWFGVLVYYWFSRDSYIAMSDEALGLMLVAKSLAFAFLLAFSLRSSPFKRFETDSPVGALNDRLISAALLIIAIGAPLTYQRAVQLSGDDIFTVIGYIRLREALTSGGEGFGILGYLTVPSFVIATLCVTQYALHRKGLVRMLLAVSVSLFYTYLSTGRTFALLLIVLLFAPLILLRRIGFFGVIGAALVVMGLFVFVASMTAKGIAVEASFSDNVDTFLELLRAYTVAPLLAFSLLLSDLPVSDWGANTFRVVYAAIHRIGLSETPPVALIRDFVFVPDQTNVYTVYDVYLTDFSYLGVLVPPLFLLGHWVLYRRAIERGGLWVFFCAASYYPLLMQFFQDAYVTLMSQWVQFVFWFWLLLRARTPVWLTKPDALAARK